MIRGGVWKTCFRRQLGKNEAHLTVAGKGGGCESVVLPHLPHARQQLDQTAYTHPCSIDCGDLLSTYLTIKTALLSCTRG